MAQKRRKEQLMKRRERRLTALCIGGGIGAMLLSLFVCMMIFDIGPRGVSIGDSLDTLLSRYPSTYTNSKTTGDLTGEQSNEEMILYCAQYFENQNGVMTALPPRGLLTVDSGSIIVTLMAPTSAYPAGTLEQYSRYEHVYCIYTVSPDTMTVQSIVLGLSR